MILPLVEFCVDIVIIFLTAYIAVSCEGEEGSADSFTGFVVGGISGTVMYFVAEAVFMMIYQFAI